MDAGFIARNAVRIAARGELAFEFDRIPLVATGIRGRKLTNLVRIAGNRLLPIATAQGYPYMAHVSPANVCNVHCERCPAHDPATAARTFLPFDIYEKFMDGAAPYLLYAILWSWGEPLLNPDIYRMIESASRRNVLTITSSNLNHFGEDHAREMVASGLDAIIVALDGTNPETYARTRPGGTYSAVVENTRLLVEAKRRAASSKPLINLRMVVTQENEAEVEDFKLLARELGVDMVSFKAFSTRQAGYSDPEWDRVRAPRTSGLRWYEYERDFRRKQARGEYDCRFPWTKPTLFPDGSILACEFDLGAKHAFGNLHDSSFEDIWFGEQAQTTRRAFQRDRNSLPFCRECVYDNAVIEGCVLTWEYLDHD